MDESENDAFRERGASEHQCSLDPRSERKLFPCFVNDDVASRSSAHTNMDMLCTPRGLPETLQQDLTSASEECHVAMISRAHSSLDDTSLRWRHDNHGSSRLEGPGRRRSTRFLRLKYSTPSLEEGRTSPGLVSLSSCTHVPISMIHDVCGAASRSHASTTTFLRLRTVPSAEQQDAAEAEAGLSSRGGNLSDTSRTSGQGLGTLMLTRHQVAVHRVPLLNEPLAQ